MANNTGPKEQGSSGAPQGDREPRVLMPSEIAGIVQGIVVSLETIAEQSQRRILESVRVQLGLQQAPAQRPPTQNQQRSQQSNGNNNQRRGTGQ